MPAFLENFGLDFLAEDMNALKGFMGHVAQEGKEIIGYYGCPQFFMNMGDVDIYIKTRWDENDQLTITGMDTHCCGNIVWAMRNTGMSLTPEDALCTERLYMFELNKDESGIIPIHLVNGDILPSFLKGDIVEMQVCALPLEINYYADQDEYENSQPANEKGEHWLVNNGSLFPAAFLVNHNPDHISQADFHTDDEVTFTATVQDLYYGVFETEEDKYDLFIRCIADTEYGKLTFVHTRDQVPPELRKNMKPGSVISGVCVLSGDVAIHEYENGLIRDAEHNLKLVLQAFSDNKAERLRSALSDNCTYISEASKKTFTGADEIIDRLEYVFSNKRDKHFPHAATITKADGEGMKYAAGTSCIALAYKTPDSYESIVFVDTDEDGYITKILITTDSRYKFNID